MTGKYQHSIDAKGRLFIPSKLREEIGDVCYVTLSMDECLSVYSTESWNLFRAKFDALPLSRSRKMRSLFANTAKCELDSQGRILIPQELRDFVGLDRNVMIVGVSNHAEIWDLTKWTELETEELTPENIAAAMEELGF